MRKVMILALFMASTTNSIAQTWYRNLEKYWFYRYRLVNDFMKIGTSCGESIPAQARLYPNVWGGDGNALTWEDATVELGNYIGALALEYRMLKDNHWDTERTELELYYALMAIKRLDESAESYNADINTNSMCNPQPWGAPFGPIWNNNTHGSLNGFFLRDDVWYDNAIPGASGTIKTPDFVYVNSEHFNRPGIYYHPNNIIGGVKGSLPSSSVPDGAFSFDNKATRVYNCASWDAARPDPGMPDHSYPSTTPLYSDEETPDQVVAMFTGLSVATNLLDDDINVGVMEDLRYEAASTAKRIVSWIPKPQLGGVVDPPYFTLTDILPYASSLAAPYSWTLKNPLTLKCINSRDPEDYGSFDMCMNGAFGPASYAWSATRAVHKSVRAHYIGTGLADECAALLLKSEWPTYWAIFNASQFSSIPSHGGLRDLCFTDAYTAVSGAWRIEYPMTGIGINTSWKSIRDHSMNSHFNSPHFPLIYRINFSKPGIDFCPECHTGISYDLLLNTAPECGPYHRFRAGTCSTCGPSYSEREWSGSDRLNEWFHRDGYDEEGYDYNSLNNRDFNGLDYMFLFNLYSFHKGDYLHFIFNPYYVKNYSKPFPDGTLGTDSHPLKLNFLEYLSCKNNISSGANVIFRSAHETELLSGFEANNCTFEAIVKDYVCTSEPSVLGDANEPYHFAYDGTAPIEYNPTGDAYIPRTFSDSDYINSHIEDSLANSPMVEEGIGILRDSIRNYLQHTRDPMVAEYMVKYGFINRDGTFPISSPLIPQKTIKYNDWVEISPNPATDFANITYDLFEQNKIEISLYNTLGQDFSVYINPYDRQQDTGKHYTYINVSDLARGIYYVKITIGSQVVVKKLTVI